MTRRLPFATVDVFTERRFAGNPLAIVENADGLASELMQTVAREFNLSETIFVQTPDDPANTAKVRIFFPTAEIPFAGHPTVGCAIFLALKANPGSADFDTEIALEEVAGRVPVRVRRRDGSVIAQLTAPVVPSAGTGALPDTSLAAGALGLEASDIGFASHEVGRFEGGPEFLFIPLASRLALARARPAEPGWSRMVAETGRENAYVYTPGSAGEGIDFHARMFAPGNGIPEDPATGSASAILAAQLLAAGQLAEGTSRFVLEQGRDMGRLSRVGLEADVEDGRLVAVRISGGSVPVSTGEIEISWAP